MNRRRRILTVVALLILSVFAVYQNNLDVAGQQSSYQKGIGYATYFNGLYSSAQSDQTIENIADTGAEWVNILVTQYQFDLNSTNIYPTSKTPTDEDLIHVIAKAKSVGLKVMLKPHVDIQSNEAEWRGRIGQNFSSSQWSAWFSTYRNFIGHYAELAEEHGVEQFVIGTELVTTSARESDWRRVASHVRDRYSGPITYSANHTGEETNIRWWDAVDYIGLSGYYNLTDKNNPTVAELRTAWQPHIQTLETLSQQYNRDIVFTEVGYRSSDGNNTHPWCHWCNESLDLQEQLDTYQAFFQAVATQPWFEGVFWWGWDMDPEDNGVCDDGYSPHLKPAENIVRSQYGGNQISIATTCGGTVTTPSPTPNLPISTITVTPPTPEPPTGTPAPANPTAIPTTSPTALPPTSTPIAPPPIGQCGGLRQEAEAGAFSPSAFRIGQDSGVNGEYIEALSGRAFGTFEPTTNATYCVNIPSAGLYGMRARSMATDSFSNSLYLYVDGLPNQGYSWHLWATGNFVVTDVYVAEGDDPNPSKFEILLSAGEHQISFAGRESGSRLDWFELIPLGTNPQPTPTVVPTTAPPSEPTTTPVSPPTPTPSAPPVVGCGGVQQEAEQGQLSGLFSIGSDNAANGGAYVHVPNGQGNRGSVLDPGQKVSYCVQVNSGGIYRLKGWTYGASGFDNSFYVRVNGQPSQGVVWHTQIQTAYSDEYVMAYNIDTNRFEVAEFSLVPGENLVEFFLREDGVRLDRFAIEEIPVSASGEIEPFVDLLRLENDITFGSPIDEQFLYLPFVQQ
ncbi:MAG: hypothetical protein AAF438_16445 [Pseudomonadota bacterium]